MSLKRTFLEAESGSWTLWGNGTVWLTSHLKKAFLWSKQYMLMLVKIEIWSRMFWDSLPLIPHYVHSLVCIILCMFYEYSYSENSKRSDQCFTYCSTTCFSFSYVRRSFSASIQLVISFEKNSCIVLIQCDIISLVQPLLMNFYIIYNY